MCPQSIKVMHQAFNLKNRGQYPVGAKDQKQMWHRIHYRVITKEYGRAAMNDLLSERLGSDRRLFALWAMLMSLKGEWFGVNTALLAYSYYVGASSREEKPTNWYDIQKMLSDLVEYGALEVGEID